VPRVHLRGETHAYWDGLLGDGGGPPDAEALAATLPSPDAAAATVDDPTTWVRESEKLAEQFVYSGPVGDGAGPFALTDACRAEAKRVAEQQVALAKVGLADGLVVLFCSSARNTDADPSAIMFTLGTSQSVPPPRL